jgi:hypothetical protein
MFGDFLIICREVLGEKPESFIMTPAEARELAHRGEKNGVVSFWLQPKQYESASYREAWGRIGSGQ